MKNKLSYIVMSLALFNLFFIFCYYFKIVNFLYINFADFNVVFNVIFTNLFVAVFDAFYIILFNKIKLYKLSYLFICFLGAFIGLVMSVIVLRFSDNYEIIDHLGIISFFAINTVFISYSLYFEKVKKTVFS